MVALLYLLGSTVEAGSWLDWLWLLRLLHLLHDLLQLHGRLSRDNPVVLTTDVAAGKTCSHDGVDGG